MAAFPAKCSSPLTTHLLLRELLGSTRQIFWEGKHCETSLAVQTCVAGWSRRGGAVEATWARLGGHGSSSWQLLELAAVARTVASPG